jgi:adenylosuccinate lyase
VNVDRMRENLELSRGVVFSGTVLLELAQRGVSREQAYEWVQRNALRSYDEQKDFKQLLLADKEVMGVLDPKAVEDAFNLKVQLKNVATIFDRVFGPAAAAAAGQTRSSKLEAGS